MVFHVNSINGWAVGYLKIAEKKRGVGVMKKELDARQGRILKSRHKQAHSFATAKLS
jgi:hypothetical protein